MAGAIDPDTGAVDAVDDRRLARRAANGGPSTLRVADDGTLRAHRITDPDQPRDIATLPGGRSLVLAPDPTGDDSLRSIELNGEGVTQHGVAVVEDRTMRSLSIAVDLLDPDHPSADRPAPDWPWSEGRKDLLFYSGILLLVLLEVWSRVRRRRCQRRSAR